MDDRQEHAGTGRPDALRDRKCIMTPKEKGPLIAAGVRKSRTRAMLDQEPPIPNTPADVCIRAAAGFAVLASILDAAGLAGGETAREIRRECLMAAKAPQCGEYHGRDKSCARARP